MLRDALLVGRVLAILGAFCGTAYYFLGIWSALRFLRRRSTGEVSAVPITPAEQTASPRSFPPVSVLKPLKGTDPEMYGSFCSHCQQNYPEYEIIFGVSDPDDPSVALVKRLQHDFPQVPIRLLICSKILGANVKVSNLVQMAKAAEHEYLVVNDSDIRVKPNYLQKVAAPLEDATVGLVTCLYRGVAATTLGSRLESLGIATDFSAGVLVAQELEGGVRFGLGSTLAIRRRDLQAIGGFESLLDYLADDYEVGARIAALGFDVRLADTMVDTFLPAYSMRDFIHHQLRWARSVRDSRPWGYFGLVLTFGLPWALLGVLLSPAAAWAWILLAGTLIARLALAVVVSQTILADHRLLRWLWLVPLRDVLAVVVWIASYAGHTIRWRGDYFQLRDGKLARMEP
jgi:ceramide glucosyltransferase